MTTVKRTTPTLIPTLRYRDAAKAIRWLCDAFGFEEHMVVPGEAGSIEHAQLCFGNGMIMVGSTRDDEWGKLVTTPKAAGGNSQSAYVIVADCDAHYARAKAAGAEIVMELEEKDYGGKGYGCRDLEGHVWSFGSYDPWAS